MRLLAAVMAAFALGAGTGIVAGASSVPAVHLAPGQYVTVYADPLPSPSVAPSASPSGSPSGPYCTLNGAIPGYPSMIQVTGYGLTPGATYQAELEAYSDASYTHWVYAEVLDAKAKADGTLYLNGTTSNWNGYWWEAQIQPFGAPDDGSYLAECDGYVIGA